MWDVYHTHTNIEPLSLYKTNERGTRHSAPYSPERTLRIPHRSVISISCTKNSEVPGGKRRPEARERNSNNFFATQRHLVEGRTVLAVRPPRAKGRWQSNKQGRKFESVHIFHICLNGFLSGSNDSAGVLCRPRNTNDDSWLSCPTFLLWSVPFGHSLLFRNTYTFLAGTHHERTPGTTCHLFGCWITVSTPSELEFTPR